MGPPAALSGQFAVAVFRPDGSLRAAAAFPNGVTDDGVAYLLAAGFRGGQRLKFYLGLIAGGGFSGLRPEDTHQGHPGWVEWAGYYGRFRPEWFPAEPQAGVLATLFPSRFVARAGGTIRGAILASGQLPVLATGVLYAAGVAAAAVPVEPGDAVEVTYTITLAED
jgi:hypothetical protein